MIWDFIEKYYIDPIRYGQPYNVVDTVTYALVLILAIYIIYRWLSRSEIIRIDRDFILCTLPFVVMGGMLRVVQDTGMIESDWQFLLVTPLIYFVMFIYTAGALVISATLQARGIVRDYHRGYVAAGLAGAAATGIVLLWFGAGNGIIAWDVLFIIIAMAVLSSAAVFGVMRYLLRWRYAADPLYLSLLFGQLLDASATSYGIDLHPLHYVEVHVVGSHLIEWTGTAFSMFPLKLLVLFPGIYVLERFRHEGPGALWHLILLAMITVGLAPGVRDMMRMVLYV
ncbi:MAG: hypothetical protein A4E39_00013 [Methanoregulaceae archaeon PtaB.Bin152]|nr:MAG: hypothetical protein A4E39_00013 [Methanoregulaceae archaeon PtaB.Bin152]